MGNQTRSPAFRTVAVGVGWLMAATVAGQAPALPAAAGRPRPPKPAQVTAPVPVRPGTAVPPPVDATADHLVKAEPPVVWPAAGAVDVRFDTGSTRTKAAGLPVWVTRQDAARADRRGPDGTALDGSFSMRVEILDRTAAARAQVAGLLLRLTGIDGDGGSVRAGVEVDYSGFQYAYGGDWAGRLRVSVLPECALSTPDAAGCQATVVPSVNDRSISRLSAQLDVAAAKTAGTLVALAAGDSSSVGDFKATDLTASATWSAGGSAGDFGWSYGMRVPPSLGGPAPQVGLSYSTQSVDGRTAAANSQPSWVGEGFGFWPGFIERSYKPCQEDGVANVGDVCWGGDNATMALGGGGGELVQDGTTGVWRPKNDDGSIVEKLSGAANGDQGNGVAPAGEHWKVTALDGTEYYFGLNRLPGWTAGAAETNAAWTTTVFGNNSGEPCNQATFAASHCVQAYRWNLDYVVDRHGNTMSFWYAKATNNYARNRTDTTVSSYVRGGWLSEIKYGTRLNGSADSLFGSSAPMRVVFGVTDRCLTAGATCTSSNPSNWPDVPWDQNCASTTNCAGKYAPTYWTTKKLSTVTSQVWGGTSYRNVDRWTLTHEFKQPAPGEQPILWLKTLVHTGLVGGSESLPALTFKPDPNATYNRVDTGGVATLHRYRMSTIDNETGGTLSIGYSLRECSATNLPTVHANTKRCFPVMWVRPGETSPRIEYFHKYLVTSVVASDRLGGNPPDTTTYTYLGAPAWHYDESEFMPASRKTWGQWRGYEKVRVTHGQAPGVLTVTDQQYFRGMDEDKQPTGLRDVKVTDSDGVQLDDSPWRTGQLRETLSYLDLATNNVAAKKKIDPWQHGPTATRNRNGVVVKAYLVNASQVVDKTALDGGRGWRTTRTVNTFDTAGSPATGLITQVDNLGDDATTVDDQCTRYEYARNDPEWMRSYLTRIWTVGVSCATTPNLATQVLSDVRTYYDGATTYGATIGKGDKTREEQRADWVNGTAVYAQASRASYDANGRTLEAWDPLDRRTATAFTPATGGPVTALTVTNPLSWTANSTVEPAWGVATRTVDANNRVTDLTYDPLGRVAAAWLPGRNKAGSDSANVTFTYDVRNTGTNPTAVTTARLNKNGGYVRSVKLFDGNLQERQTQATAPDGGAIIVDILRDSRGLVVKNTEPYYINLGVGTTLYLPQYEPPGQTQTVHDTLKRPTTAIFKKNGAEQWRTSYGYGGDRVHVTPPAGATPTSTITDARGNTVELRQYHGTTPTGTYDATRYTHTARGGIATMTDAAGTIWRYTYDQRGRRIRAEDPDAGVSINTFDDAGQLLTSTDGRGQTLANSYDLLGRSTQLREGSPTGPVLAEWTWDTILKGQPGSATRYSGGNAYTSRVTAWDTAYRPLTTQVVVPAAETGLAGTYEWTSTYNIDGTVATQTLPAAGGLAAETLTFGYSDVGLPTTLSGLTSYVTGTGYSNVGQLASMSATAGGNELAQYWFWEEGTGRLAEQLAYDATAGAVFQDLYYTHDAAGNLKQIDDKVVQYGAPGPDETQCFRYDRLRRLTDAWTPSGLGNCTSNPTVAALGGPARYWHTYTYDITGNRRTEVQHASGGDTSRTYAYPAAGAAQPHTLRSVTTTGPGVNRTDNYGYDTAGSTTSRPGASAGQTLTWNSEGRLASVTENGQTTSFLYDANGGRLIRRDTSGTTLYLPGMELTKPAGSGSVSCTRFYTHAEQTVAVRNSAGLHWQVSDHHGTSHMSFNAATMAKTQRRTLPFGGIRGANPSWPSQRGFVGGTNDSTVGTVHLGAREYDAATGRFISADAIIRPTDPQQANGYSYANNSPLTFSDPTGLDYCDRHACPGDGGYVDPAAGGGGSGGCYGGNQSASCRDGGGGGSTGGSAGRPCSDGGKGTTSCDSGPPAKPVTRTYKNKTTITANPDGTFEIDGYHLPKGHPDPYVLAESVDAERGKTPRSNFASSFEELWWTTLLVGASCDALRRTDNACSFRFHSDVNGDNYIFGRAARNVGHGNDPAAALLEALAAAYMFGAARPGPSGAGGAAFVHGTAFDETYNIAGRPVGLHARVQVDGGTVWLRNIYVYTDTGSVRGDLGVRGTGDMLRVLRQDLLPRAAAQGFTHLRVTFVRVGAGAASGHTVDKTFPTGGLPGSRR